MALCSQVQPFQAKTNYEHRRSECTNQVQLQITFQSRTLELPSPRGETGSDCQRNGYRSSNEVEIADCCQAGLLAPDREDVENSACDKQGDRKVNDYWVLSMPCEERRLQIERIC